MFENPLTSTPSPTRQSFGGRSNSSIRRKSLIHQGRERHEDQNDDDAERLSLVASEKAVAAPFFVRPNPLDSSTPVQSPSPRRLRESMSLSPHNEHFQGCLKLYAENKINKANAWNLGLIDYMSNMLRRHDSRMENLQMASTVVDASARIYGLRVDAVHYDVLKMAGGLSKAAQTKRGKKNDNGCSQVEGVADGEPAAAPKKKKKRPKSAIAANPDVLNGDFDSTDFIVSYKNRSPLFLDPFFERISAIKGDVTSAHRSFNANLPIDDATLGLVLSNDNPFLEPIKENVVEEIDLTDRITLSIKLLPKFTEADHICEPFSGFSITNWNPETEDTDIRVSNWVEDNQLNLSQQAFAFDVDAEVEPIPQDDAQNDLFNDEPLTGIESDEEADAAVAALAAVVCEGRQAATTGRAILADMRPSSATDARLEYSYNAIVTAWAGPAHWRLKNNRASKVAERTQTTAGGRTVDGSKKAGRTKRQLDFMGAGLAFDCRAEPTGEYEPVQPSKILISRKTLATGQTWHEKNYMTTIDRGLDESHFRKLSTRPRVVLQRHIATPAGPADTAGVDQQPAIAEAADYDYENENDHSYCVNNVPDGNEWGNEDGVAAGDPYEHTKVTEVAELGDLLEPPTRIPKVFIPYAMRAKKVDMKQLKRCTWKMLTEKSRQCEEEDVEPTTFSEIYKRLPKKLSSNMSESLSVPLALLSVLHLANEKGLILEQKGDLKDIDIVGLIKK